MKYVIPSTSDTAFNCPHCGALATQYWHSLVAFQRSEEHPLPKVVGETGAKEFDDFSDIEDGDIKKALILWADQMATGQPFLEKTTDKLPWNPKDLWNVSLSNCFNCGKVSIWIHDRLVYPSAGHAPPANTDMSDEIRRDYDEASSILEQSPRGAAALIRLGIQKLCKELGQPGENINNDIGALVAGGLDVRLQQALDAVRVIGNHAVHPGQIDLRDDRATAEMLFKLLNLIVDKLISEPKHITEIYGSLPQSARDAIEKRDTKSNK
jgi:predicted RNA-binding Zn-ribbon protein involved in translation (DUF1610 family)